MKRHEKRHVKKSLAVLLSAVLTCAAVWHWIPAGVREVRAADVIEVDNANDLRTAVEQSSGAVSVKLTDSITLIKDDFETGATFTLPSNAKVTLDLAGNSISASGVSSTSPLFLMDSYAELTIQDSKGTGSLQSANGGQCVKSINGTLNIEGGTFTNAAQCLDVSNTTVNIKGGSFVTNGNGNNDIALMISGNNTNVTISGGYFESSYGTIWVMDSVNNNSSLNIKDGTITANEKGNFAYVCSVAGKCNVNISGGTFNLEPAEGSARKGSSLLLGTNVTDDLVNISGGTFNGRIARAISDTADANYEVFYGNENSGGILGDGCVFTDNTFYLQHPDYNVYFTQDEVEVVSGSLVKFNTGRSSMETYTDEELMQAYNADNYSLDPVSVGTGGIQYSNTDSNVIPAVDTSRVTDGNTYTFYRWYDEYGKTYDTVDEFIAAGEWNGAGRTVTLSAGWEAQTGTRDGLESAVNKNTTVKSILVTQNIPLNEAVTEASAGTTERILNLDGHTISSTDSDTAALVLKGKWNIKNGTITGINQPCLEIGGTATIENMDCLSDNAACAVKFGSGLSENRIISGTFEATGEEGHALCITDTNQTVTVADMKELFGDSYASSTGIITDNNGNIYLAASRLIVSESPITYIGNGADTDLGSYVYGESVPTSTQIISNEKYVGDIVITGVSVDNPVFTVTGAGEPKYLRGGVSRDENSYSYAVGVAENTDAGKYTGTVTISYTRMDGSTGEYIQKLSLTITPKQLTIAESVVTKEKVYDKTTTAEVQTCTLAGVADGDDVTVTATAFYDSANAETGKKITVKYTLAGADKGNYLAPVNTEITDGIINKADGVAGVLMADYHVGENAPSAVLSSATNGIADVTLYYKQKGATDDTYTTLLPTKEGNYTIRAVFAGTANYNTVTAEDDFVISYIDTPENAYTLSGTLGKDGWYTSQVIIYPVSKYMISNIVDGTYGNLYTLNNTSEPVIFLKNENGAVTRPISIGKINIDMTAPKITGVDNGGNYNVGSRIARIADENLKRVTVNGVDITFTGTTAEVILKSSSTEYVLKAEDMAGNTVTYRFYVKKLISSDCVTNLTRDEEYRLEIGSWKVKGDNTVYNGNINFYVTEDGEYEFQKQ